MEPLPSRPALTKAWGEALTSTKTHSRTILHIACAWFVFHLLYIGLQQVDNVKLEELITPVIFLSSVLSIVLWVYAHHKTMDQEGTYVFSGKPISSPKVIAWLAIQHVLAFFAAILAFALIILMTGVFGTVSRFVG